MIQHQYRTGDTVRVNPKTRMSCAGEIGTIQGTVHNDNGELLYIVLIPPREHNMHLFEHEIHRTTKKFW